MRSASLSFHTGLPNNLQLQQHRGTRYRLQLGHRQSRRGPPRLSSQTSAGTVPNSVRHARGSGLRQRARLPTSCSRQRHPTPWRNDTRGQGNLSRGPQKVQRCGSFLLPAAIRHDVEASDPANPVQMSLPAVAWRGARLPRRRLP